jgi:hypothetical protein
MEVFFIKNMVKIPNSFKTSSMLFDLRVFSDAHNTGIKVQANSNQRSCIERSKKIV